MKKNKKITLKFSAFDHRILDREVQRVLEAVRKTGAEVVGPMPMPRRIERFTVNRSTHVDKESREQFEIRTFKRNMIITPSEQTMDALMKLELAAGVDVEIKASEGGTA
jgi:small subunit ribosomal protein S10